jgi:hypothetical protein
VTDRATVACLGDVFVRPEWLGLGRWLMECVHSHPDLRRLRRWILLTRDAHGLYRRSGWTDLNAPERWVECRDPHVYER